MADNEIVVIILVPSPGGSSPMMYIEFADLRIRIGFTLLKAPPLPVSWRAVSLRSLTLLTPLTDFTDSRARCQKTQSDHRERQEAGVCIRRNKSQCGKGDGNDMEAVSRFDTLYNQNLPAFLPSQTACKAVPLRTCYVSAIATLCCTCRRTLSHSGPSGSSYWPCG